LCGKPVGDGDGGLTRPVHTRWWAMRPGPRVQPALLGCTREGQPLVPNLQPRLFRLSHQGHKPLARASALPANAAPDCLAVVRESARLRLQREAPGGQLVSHVRDPLADFWGA
jgi:hypothetical protein